MKQLPEYPGLSISEDGRVFRNGHEKKQRDRGGYNVITYILKRKVYILRQHRLLAMAFIPNPLNHPHVNHRNGIKNDNRLENLEWCSAQQNMTHAFDTGLIQTRKSVVQSNMYGNEIATYKSITEAAEMTGIKHANISACCNNRRKQTGGYRWHLK
jgi:hypothetical protein